MCRGRRYGAASLATATATDETTAEMITSLRRTSSSTDGVSVTSASAARFSISARSSDSRATS